MKEEKATFAAGCFWHVQEVFDKIPGVIKTTVGYTGGSTDNPSYKEVSSGNTGHAEAIEVIYDADKVNYEQLLESFWNMHDPTQLNRQGPDVGTNYRSAIFYHNEEQKKLAEESKEKEAKEYDKGIVTKIVKASKFYPAEDYHQRYNEKRGKTCIA
jgi:peptide-methionine (S)-S-oxide reductase